MRRAGIFVAVLLLMLGSLPLAQADRVVLKNGRSLEGTIVLDSPTRVIIQTATGIRTLRRSEIFEVVKGKDPSDLYREKAAAIRKGTAEDHFGLGQWCKEAGLASEAQTEFLEAIRIDNDHAGAREELGYVLRGGRWVLEGTKEPAPKPAPKKGSTGGKEVPPPTKESGEKPKEDDPDGGARSTKARGLTVKHEENRKAAREAWRKKIASYDGVPWERAWEIQGPGYLLKCNSTREVARWYARALAKIDQELRRFFRGAKVIRFANTSTSVLVYKSHQEFMDKEGMPPGIGGFFRIGNGSIHAYHGEFGATGDTIAVLGHEYTHKWESMVVNGWKKMPPWIYEGLAVYFGDGIVVPRKGKARSHQIPRDRLRVVQRAIPEGRYIKVRDLIRTKPRGFSGFHYAHAWSVIYFMVNTSETNKTVFNRLFSNMINTQFEASQFEDICKGIGGVDGFEEKWKEWVMALELPPPGNIDEELGTFRSDFADFSLSLPDEAWKFVLTDDSVPVDQRMAFQVGMEKDKAMVTILAKNNPEHLSADAVAQRKADALKTDENKELFDVISTERINLNGYEAYQVVYKDKIPEKKKAKGKDEGKSEEKKKPEEEKPKKPENPEGGEKPAPGEEGAEKAPQKPEEPEPKKFRRVYLTTVPHIIVIEIAAPIAKFGSYDSEFAKVLQSVQLHFD